MEKHFACNLKGHYSNPLIIPAAHWLKKAKIPNTAYKGANHLMDLANCSHPLNRK